VLLPAAALLTKPVLAGLGAAGVLGLWTLTILLGGAVELVGIRRGRRQHGRTPLHSAVSDQRIEMVELLLSKGAEINALDGQHNTPMYYADSHGAGARIRDLLRQRGGVGAFGEPR